MSDGLLTLTDIARQLELPASTVRYYRDRFRQFIPSVEYGRYVQYRPEAVDVMRVIADRMRSNHTVEEIEAELARGFARTVEVTSAESGAGTHDDPPLPDLARTAALDRQLVSSLAPVLTSQTEALRQIATSLEAIASRNDELDALRRSVDALTALLQKDADQAAELRKMAESIDRLVGRRATETEALARTAAGLEKLAEQNAHLSELEEGLESVRRAQEMYDLKRRITEARRDREQEERERRLLEQISRNERTDYPPTRSIWSFFRRRKK